VVIKLATNFMRNCLVLKVTLLVFLISGASTLSLAASATNQQSPARIVEPEQINLGDRITVYEKSGRVLELIVEESITTDQPAPDTSLTGTWASDITDNTNNRVRFFKENNKKLVVTFEQNGEKTVGKISSLTDGYIEGTREEDTIKFIFYSPTITNYELRGEWKVSADGNRLEGSWRHPVSIASGKWNLTRLDPVVATRQAEPPMIKGKLVLDQSDVEVLLADIDKIEVRHVVSTAEESPAIDFDEAAPNATTSSPKPSSSKSSKSSNSKYSKGYQQCVLKASSYGLIPIIFGVAELGILTTVAGTVLCVPAVGIGVSMDASMKPSVDASSEATTNKDQAAYRKTEQQRFFALTRDNLARDMARGGGEYLTAMAYLEGCPVEVHDSFAKMTQRNFKQIIPQAEMDAEDMLHNLELQIAKDPQLVAKCSSVS